MEAVKLACSSRLWPRIPFEDCLVAISHNTRLSDKKDLIVTRIVLRIVLTVKIIIGILYKSAATIVKGKGEMDLEFSKEICLSPKC